MDRVPTSGVAVDRIEVPTRPQAIDVHTMKFGAPLFARRGRLTHLALSLVLLEYLHVLLVGWVIFGFLFAQAVSRFPYLVEDESRVHQRLEAVDVILVRVRERGAGEAPDVLSLLRVIFLLYDLSQVTNGIDGGMVRAIDIDDHESSVG